MVSPPVGAVKKCWKCGGPLIPRSRAGIAGAIARHLGYSDPHRCVACGLVQDVVVAKSSGNSNTQ